MTAPFLHNKKDVLALAGRPIAYYPRITLLTDSPNAAILLCQLLYWTDRGAADDGWIWKRHADLRRECGLTRHEFLSAKAALVRAGLVEHRCQGFPRISWYRVNLDTLTRLLTQLADEGGPLPG